MRKKVLLFVNKKKQKNFARGGYWPVSVSHRREAEQTFFGAFFQKSTSSFLSSWSCL